jgi:Xaa-Pro aminopeptidase
VTGGDPFPRFTGAELFPRFSDVEYARRFSRVRELMAARGLDALVVFGDSSFQGSNHANVLWLANWLDPYMAYVLFPATGEPALFISNPLYRHTAVRASNLRLVEWGGANPGRTIGERLRDLGLARRRIGTVGVRNVGRASMPSEHHLALREMLPEATIEDALELMQDARMIKSAEEITWFERGAALTDRAVDAIARAIRIGMPEHQLSTAVHDGVLPHGGRVMFHFLGATAMDDPEIVFPWQYPSCRPIQAGDIVMTEISASYWGYAGQIQRPYAVGREPTKEYQALYDVAAECYQRMLEALRPGASDHDVRRAAGLVATKGYRTLDALAHGWGVTIEPPRIDVPSVAMIEREQTPVTFSAGMLLVIQPHVVSADARRGVQIGNLVVVEANGARALQRYPLEFVRVTGAA